MTRPLTSQEKGLITKIAERLAGDERQKLLADLESASAQPGTADGSRILFEIAGYEGPPSDENGRLLELELIRWDPGELIRPSWETL